MSALAGFEDSDTLRIEALAFDLDIPDQIAGHRTRPKLCVEKVSGRIALATALLALGWCFAGASLASSAHEAPARATAGTNRTSTPRLATVLATGEPVMTIGANEFAVASSSPYPAPLGTHLHSSDGGVYGNPSDEAEVGSLGEEEEVRGLAEFVLDGQPQASTATLTFRVGILGGLFEQPFGVFDIAVAAYDGNDGGGHRGFRGARDGVGRYLRHGDSRSGTLVTFDVTGPFNVGVERRPCLRSGPASAGQRSGDAAATFEDFRSPSRRHHHDHDGTDDHDATDPRPRHRRPDAAATRSWKVPEQCDLGAQNGTPGPCCTGGCTLRPPPTRVGPRSGRATRPSLVPARAPIARPISCVPPATCAARRRVPAIARRSVVGSTSAARRTVSESPARSATTTIPRPGPRRAPTRWYVRA